MYPLLACSSSLRHFLRSQLPQSQTTATTISQEIVPKAVSLLNEGSYPLLFTCSLKTPFTLGWSDVSLGKCALSLIPGTPMVEGESHLLEVVLLPLHTHHGRCMVSFAVVFKILFTQLHHHCQVTPSMPLTPEDCTLLLILCKGQAMSVCPLPLCPTDKGPFSLLLQLPRRALQWWRS